MLARELDPRKTKYLLGVSRKYLSRGSPSTQPKWADLSRHGDVFRTPAAIGEESIDDLLARGAFGDAPRSFTLVISALAW